MDSVAVGAERLLTELERDRALDEAHAEADRIRQDVLSWVATVLEDAEALAVARAARCVRGDGTVVFRELQPQGYTGSYRRVAAYASRLRQAQGLPPRRQGRRQTLPVVAEPPSPPLTPRREAGYVAFHA